MASRRKTITIRLAAYKDFWVDGKPIEQRFPRGLGLKPDDEFRYQFVGGDVTGIGVVVSCEPVGEIDSYFLRKKERPPAKGFEPGNCQALFMEMIIRLPSGAGVKLFL